MSDYGLSFILTEIASGNLLNGVVQSNIGSVNWMAPEVLNFGDNGTYSDIWSLGAIVIQMLTGKDTIYWKKFLFK